MALRRPTCSALKTESDLNARTIALVASPTGEAHKLGSKSSGAASQKAASSSRCSSAAQLAINQDLEGSCTAVHGKAF